MPTVRRIRQNAGVRSVRRGFTLTEVLIAIAIVVVLGGIVAVNFMQARRDARVDEAKIDLNNFRVAIEQFELIFDRVPTDDEGLAVLWSRESLDVEDESLASRWRSFITRAKPNDPWGNPWNYRAESEHGLAYDLWSNGPDGDEGTDDDITNWAGTEGSDGMGGVPLPPAGR